MQYWSWCLMAVGVFGLYLAGRRNELGWAVSLLAQGLWITYALATDQPGFLVSAVVYGWVYAKNFLAWRTHPPRSPEAEESEEKGCDRCKR